MATARYTAVRILPAIGLGIAIWVAYTVLIFLVGLVTDAPYTQLGASGRNLFPGAGISLVIGTVFLAVTASILDWLRPALFELRHGSGWRSSFRR